MRITESLARSRSKRIQRETDAIAPQATNLQGTVEDATQQGLTVRTQNDGVITVAAPTGTNASVGDTIQATASGGAIQAGLSPQPMARAGESAGRVPQVRYKLRAPVVGQDFGWPGDYWIYEKSAESANGVAIADLYAWSPVQGAYVLISGSSAIIEQNGYIEVPAVQSYPIIHSARYPSQIVALYGSAGTTATLSVAVGNSVAVGESLNLVVSATDGSPYAFTVEYVRL